MIISMWQSGGGFYNVFRRWTTERWQRLGHTVRPLPTQGSVAQLGDMIFSMNFSPELARLAKEVRKPYVCWVWDALVNYSLLNPSWASDYTIMFQFARSDMERFKKAGYKNVFYLPASTDPQTWSAGSAESKYGVTFIGNCYPRSSSQYPSYKAACVSQGIPSEYGLRVMDEFLEEVVRNPAHDLRACFMTFVKTKMPRFFEVAPAPDRKICEGDPDHALDFFVNYLLYHEVDIRMRSGLLRAVSDLGVDLWGEAQGWSPHLREGIRFHGPCDFETQMGAVMTASQISLNMSRTISDGVNMRSFEIPACGSMQLALHSDEMSALYEDGKEVILFSTFEEARQKAAFYLTNETELRHIAEAGHARFLREHTLEHRFAALSATLKAIGL
jgi:spore maturation protein CgeB